MSIDWKKLTPEFIQSYNKSGPRYTSYPTVPNWASGEFSKEYTQSLKETDVAQKPISLYVHLPFCSRLCTFCGCNKYITSQHEIVVKYLDALDQELAYVASNFGERPVIQQLHFGGGTPTHLNIPQLQHLMKSIHTHFEFHPEAELAIETHPRVTSNEQLAALYELGFRRISFGVQDSDPAVQTAINRNQTLEQTQSNFYEARRLGYTGINIDLVYGLPKQTVQTFEKTIDEVHEMGPDRLAVYSFAYIPNMFKTHERAIKEQDLPPTEDKLAIYLASIAKFTDYGYQMIGMDHYATPQDELSVAQREGSLHRNFMGYTTLKGLSMIGVGVSSISDFGNAYYQNEKDLHQYIEDANIGKFQKLRYQVLNADDVLRRDMIDTLMCQGRVEIPKMEQAHGIDFESYFAHEWPMLQPFQEEGLLELNPALIQLTDLGVLFMRNIAMVFDSYLPKNQEAMNFSKTV